MPKRPQINAPRKAAAASPPTPAAGDRAATLFDHADESTNIVQFYEMSPDRRWIYLGRYEIPDVRALGVEEFASEQWGGGKYKAGLRSRSGSEYGASVVFEIAGAPKSAADRANARRGPQTTAPAAAAAPANAALPGWVNSIVLPIGATFATAFGTLLAKKILEKPQTDPLMLELIRAATARNAGGGAGSTIDPIAMMTKLLELQEQIAERVADRAGGGESDGLGAVISSTVPQLVGVLNRKLDIDERRMTQRRVSAPAAPPPPVAPAAAAAPDTPAPATPTGDELTDFALQIPLIARAFLYEAAAADESPELYAELVLEKLTDEAYDTMPRILARGDVVDVLVQVVPKWAPYREWFTNLVIAMRASLSEGATDDTTEALRGGAAPGDPVDEQADVAAD